MAVRLGKNARLKIGTNEVGRINSFNITMGGTTVDTTSFGDSIEKKALVMQGYTGTCEGFWDEDNVYQNQLQSVAASGGSLDDLRFYVDADTYYAPDTVLDAEATCYITNFATNADKAGVVNFSMSFEFSGPVLKTSP